MRQSVHRIARVGVRVGVRVRVDVGLRQAGVSSSKRSSSGNKTSSSRNHPQASVQLRGLWRWLLLLR